jgi:hypothetical protein
VFAAHLRAVTWRSATAADRNLFQAPFRAGIAWTPISSSRSPRRCGCPGSTC